MNEVELKTVGKMTSQESAEFERHKRLIRNMLGDLGPIN